MERLQRTNLAIESSIEHVEESASEGSNIESYLTQYILIILCAEVQQNIYSICRNRAEKSGDDGVKMFANAAVTKLLRSIDKKNLAGFVGNFGAACKNNFNASLEESEFQRYTNAVKSRHDIAHNSGTTITLRELSEIVPIAEKVLNAIEESIDIHSSPTETN